MGAVDEDGEVDVIGIVSPPRVTTRAEKYGLRPGPAYDLRGIEPSDIRDPACRAKIREDVKRKRPFCVIGCPPCTVFSVLQAANPNKDSPELRQRYYEALGFLGFCAEVYRMQAGAGRLYIHEHPASASSWKIDPMKTLAAEYGAYLVKGDQCMFGLMTRTIGGGEAPAKKHTMFLTNSLAVAGA